MAGTNNQQKEEEEHVLTQYFENFLHDKLEFTESAGEVSDIKSAVRTLVRNVMEEVKKKDAKFKMVDLIPFGDMAEGSMVIKPDEFKFMTVLEHLSKPGVIKVKQECENWDAFTHVNITDETALETWSDFCEKGMIKSTPQNLSLFGYSTLQGDYKKRFLLEAFSEHVEKAVNSLHQQERHTVRSAHGNLSLDTNVVTSQQHATPKLSLTWHSSNKRLKILVDLIPAIEIRDINDLVSERDTFSQMIYQAIQETGRVHLIPAGHQPICRESACFFISCEETQVRLIRSMNVMHAKCTKILKGLFKHTKSDAENFLRYINPNYLLGSLIFHRNTDAKKITILDRVLNTLLIEHTINCPETENLGGCVQTILREMENRLGGSPLLNSPALTYFKEKKLSSVFFKGYNIFSEEEIGYSTFGYQAAGETISHTQTHIMKTLDNETGRNRHSFKDLLQLFIKLMLLGCPLLSILTMIVSPSSLYVSPAVFNGLMLVVETAFISIRLIILRELYRRYFHDFNGILPFRFLFFIGFSGRDMMRYLYPLHDILRILDVLLVVLTGKVQNYWEQPQDLSFSLLEIALSWFLSLHTAVGFIVYLYYGKYTNIFVLSILYGIASGVFFANFQQLIFGFSYDSHGSYDYDYYYDD